jgi:hypothetical protein
MAAKPLKIATYNLGEKGVVVTKSPVHGQDGELAFAQNATPVPEGGLSGIHKRFGFLALNAVAAAGPIFAFISAALTDPGSPPPETVVYPFGRFLYSSDGGATWTYLDVRQETVLADIPPTIAAGMSLAFLQAADGSTTGQVAGTQEAGANVWAATAVPASAYDQGRVPYVIPKCLSVGGKMFYWSDATGAVRVFDGATDAEAWDLNVTAALDWCTDGTSIYVLVTEAGVQRVYAVLLSDYSSAQLGDDLDFTAACIETVGTTLYVGGYRGTVWTSALGVVASMPLGGGSWTDEFAAGFSESQAATTAYAFLGTDANFSNGDTITVGGQTYTFQTTLTNVDGNVLIGATANQSLAYLAAAISNLGGRGTAYATGTTTNTQVSAYMRLPSQLVAHALVIGTGGNGIGCTSSQAHAWWYGEGGVPRSDLYRGFDAGTVTVNAYTVTDLIGGTDVLYAALTSNIGFTEIRKLASATWSTVRSMIVGEGGGMFVYAAIWADGDESLWLETPLAIVTNLSKGVALGSAVFFLIGLGDVAAPAIAMIALAGGTLQRIEVPA